MPFGSLQISQHTIVFEFKTCRLSPLPQGTCSVRVARF